MRLGLILFPLLVLAAFSAAWGAAPWLNDVAHAGLPALAMAWLLFLAVAALPRRQQH